MATINEVLSRGFQHHHRGEYAQAEQLYRQVLQADPRQPDAWNGMGVLAQQLGNHRLAVQYLQQAININSNNCMYYSNMGVALHDLGQYDHAVQCHQRALQLNPNDPAAYNNLGIVLRDLGRLDESMVCCQNAIRLRPDYAEAHNNLGNVHKDQNNFEEAQRCYEHAVSLNPKYGPGLNNLGVVYREQGRMHEARDAFQRSYGIAPNDGLRIKRALVMPVVLKSAEQMLAERRRLQEEIRELLGKPLQLPDPVTKIGMTVFYPAYHGLNDCELHEEIAQVCLRATPSLNFVAAHCRDDAEARPAGRIKIGFVSKFFNEHTISKLNAGIMRNLARDRFEVFVFRFPGAEDAWAKNLRESADHTVILSPMIEQAREQIAACTLDVLFYPDIGMDPMTYFLAFARMAPVQCVTWGHPVTSGIPNIDYFISSTLLEPPGAEAHYTEQLVTLENLPTFYYAPKRSGERHSRADFKLPEGAHLYLCPQSLFKMHPEFDAVLQGILRADPQGRLLLLAGQQPHWGEILNDRFNRTIPDVVDRIEYLGRMPIGPFLDMLALVDVVLDPLHFSGGNTSFEAFSEGLPIVTMPGGFMRSRVTAAMYRRMGIADCIASSPEEYVQIAVRLATDPAWREEICSKIRESRSVLFENHALVRELEEVLEKMVRQPDLLPAPTSAAQAQEMQAGA